MGGQIKNEVKRAEIRMSGSTTSDILLPIISLWGRGYLRRARTALAQGYQDDHAVFTFGPQSYEECREGS
jgi:hypothetical protein